MSSEFDFLEYFPGIQVYCAIDDKKIDQFPKHFHEGYDLSREEIARQLHETNKKDYGIFFCVNEIDRNQDPQRHRTSKMLKRIRAVWADDDEVRQQPRSDFPISPNVVVETSPGKFHYYWLTTTTDIQEWSHVMNGIANTFQTDNNAKDLVRVLRLPGFLHHKHDAFLSHAYLGDSSVYSWEEIKQAFPPDLTIRPISDKPNGHANATFVSYTDARKAIVSGANFHGSIMWLLNHWVNSGIKNPEELKTLILDLMDQSVIQDDRWQLRVNPDYLDLNVRDAIQFVKDNPINSDIEIPTVLGEQHQLNTGYPPGSMGVLCKEIFEMAPHGNEEVALMAAYSLAAGIVGRTYNVLGTGLNLYVALLADSGVGKANLKNSINRALMIDCALEGGIAFKGASRFTGPKPLFEMLLGGLSRVCILEESGLMSASQAGDQAGLTRVMLDIYSSSGRGEFSGGESYSKIENNVPIVPSPALTIAHVSTPLSYLRALKAKDSAVSGDMARVWMMRSLRDKRTINLNKRNSFSPEITKIIKTLVKKCLPQQSVDKSNVIDIGTDYIDIQVESDYWTHLENKYRADDDQLRRTLTSRAFIKIMKIASITSIFNGRTNIGQEEYKWAHEAIVGEIATIEEALTHGSSDDMMMIVKGIIIPVISKILNSTYKDVRKCPPKTMRGKGIMTSTNLNQALRNNEVLKRLNDDPERPNPRSGIEKIIAYLIRSGLIVQISEDQIKIMGARTKVAYKVTDDFVLLMGDQHD